MNKNEETIRALVETAAQAILTVDADGRIELVNATAERIFGYSRKEMLGQPVEILIPMRLRDAHQHHLADYFIHPRSRPMGIGLDLAGRRKDDSEFPIEVSLSYIETENGIVAVSFITDITDRKLSETGLQARATSLQESQESLQALAGRLLTAQEEATQSIARELHDVFGQKMALLSLRVSEIETLLPTRPDLAAEKLRACREQIGALAQEIQEFSRQLHSGVLHELGLEIALRTECDAYARQTGATVEFSAEMSPNSSRRHRPLPVSRDAREPSQYLQTRGSRPRSCNVESLERGDRTNRRGSREGFRYRVDEGKRRIGINQHARARASCRWKFCDHQ